MSDDQTLILFGATGDLCGRHLLPALARLQVAGELAAGFRLLGTGPQRWDVPTFHDHVRTRLRSFAPDLGSAVIESFLESTSYQGVDVRDAVAVGGLLDAASGSGELTFYLALPTDLIAPTVAALAQQGLPGSARIAVEKPFGSDLASAQQLNDALARVASDESYIFRVDHFLGMPVVQALPSAVARMRRDDVAPGSEIARVSVLWEETLALEGRAAFYDRAGALKDLLQNHLVQILCQVLLEPAETAPGGWSDRRLRALRSVQIPTTGQARTSRRARYSAGTLLAPSGGSTTEVPDYVDEDGVDADRQTETFAEVSLRVDTPEWPNAEFVLRAGKAMGHVRQGLLIEVRQHSPGADTGEVWIGFDEPPADESPTAAAKPHPAIGSAPLEQLAYVNVLRDLLSGTNDLSVSREETELAWRIFTPVLQEWAAGTVPLETYPAGTTPVTLPDPSSPAGAIAIPWAAGGVDTIDYHTAGEPFRIVPDPPVAIAGATVADRRANAITSPEIDGLRRVLCFEPRGHADMYGGFITPPDDDGAHFGVLFWHKDGFSTACGHGTIALGTWAIDSGRVAVDPSGTTDVVIDVPSGRVTARVHTAADGRVRDVDFVNVPSALVQRGVAVSTSRGGSLVDIGWGGAFYACLDAASVGLRVTPEDLPALIAIGREIKAALTDDPLVRHQTDGRLSGVYGTIIFEQLGTLPTGELHQRNVTIFADGQVDRSPCGSGTAARVAVLTATGELAEGQTLVHDSIVGSRFTASVRTHVIEQGRPAVVPVVTGAAYRVGSSTFTVDLRDPLLPGFVFR